MRTDSKKHEILLVSLLILISLVVVVKRLFVGLDIDEQYSVATIYRLA